MKRTSPLDTLLQLALGALMLLVLAGPAAAQRSITSSSGGGAGIRVPTDPLQVLRNCNINDTGVPANACATAAGVLTLADAQALANQYGQATGQTWIPLPDSDSFMVQGFTDNATGVVNLQFLRQFRYNFVIGLGGTWTDPAQGGQAVAWHNLYLFEDARVDFNVPQGDDVQLAPQSLGAPLPLGSSRVTFDLFNAVGDVYITDDGALAQNVSVMAGLQIDRVSLTLFRTSPQSGGGLQVPLPGTLALAGLALGVLAWSRRRR